MKKLKTANEILTEKRSALVNGVPRGTVDGDLSGAPAALEEAPEVKKNSKRLAQRLRDTKHKPRDTQVKTLIEMGGDYHELGYERAEDPETPPEPVDAEPLYQQPITTPTGRDEEPEKAGGPLGMSDSSLESSENPLMEMDAYELRNRKAKLLGFGKFKGPNTWDDYYELDGQIWLVNNRAVTNQTSAYRAGNLQIWKPQDYNPRKMDWMRGKKPLVGDILESKGFRHKRALAEVPIPGYGVVGIIPDPFSEGEYSWYFAKDKGATHSYHSRGGGKAKMVYQLKNSAQVDSRAANSAVKALEQQIKKLKESTDLDVDDTSVEEMLDEAQILDSQDHKVEFLGVVQTPGGKRALQVSMDGVEYLYVPQEDQKPPPVAKPGKKEQGVDQLGETFQGLLDESTGLALSWLRRNAVVANSEESKES